MPFNSRLSTINATPLPSLLITAKTSLRVAVSDTNTDCGSFIIRISLLLWKFINRFHKEIKPQDNPILDRLTEYAINYFKDKVEPNKKFKKPNVDEKKALNALVNSLMKCDQSMQPEDIQSIVYKAGKENGYGEKLRDWFKLIYQVVFGDENGPRMGFFISFFGVKETIELIKEKIK